MEHVQVFWNIEKVFWNTIDRKGVTIFAPKVEK